MFGLPNTDSSQNLKQTVWSKASDKHTAALVSEKLWECDISFTSPRSTKYSPVDINTGLNTRS